MFRYLKLAICLSTFILHNGARAQNVFPSKIEVKKSADLKRVKGTKLFVKLPAGYQAIESLVRYQKNDNTYFQVLEIPESNFPEHKTKLSRKEIENKGAKVDVYESLTYNGFEAIYMEGPSKIEGETKLGLFFGDKDFVVAIACVCKSNDQESKKELIEILKTSLYDKTFKIDPLELAIFKFDETIAGFKLAATMSNMFVYTPDGKIDNNSKEESTSFQIMTMAIADFSAAKEFLDYLTKRYERQNITTTNALANEITINSNQSYEMMMDAKDENNKEYKLYQVIIYKDGNAVIFIGSDFEKGKFIEKYKATALTITL